MIILLPNTSQQTINILPRVNSIDKTIVMTIRRDGDGVSETITNAIVSNSGEFVKMSFSSTILEEDSTYYLEITRGGRLWYRDKIYSTQQQINKDLVRRVVATDGEIEFSECFDGDLDEKHVIGNNTIYKSYDKADDNTYII